MCLSYSAIFSCLGCLPTPNHSCSYPALCCTSTSFLVFLLPGDSCNINHTRCRQQYYSRVIVAILSTRWYYPRVVATILSTRCQQQYYPRVITAILSTRCQQQYYPRAIAAICTSHFLLRRLLHLIFFIHSQNVTYLAGLASMWCFPLPPQFYFLILTLLSLSRSITPLILISVVHTSSCVLTFANLFPVRDRSPWLHFSWLLYSLGAMDWAGVSSHHYSLCPSIWASRSPPFLCNCEKLYAGDYILFLTCLSVVDRRRGFSSRYVERRKNSFPPHPTRKT